VAYDLMAICCIPEVLLHLDHIGTQHVIGILFDVENDAVYVNDDGPVHFLVVLFSFCLLFAVCFLLFAVCFSAICFFAFGYLLFASGSLPATPSGDSPAAPSERPAVDVCTAKTSSSQVMSNLL